MSVAFAQDTITNDFFLVTDTTTGKKRLTIERDPIVAALAKLFRRFQFFLGEWFLDKRQGLPYFKYILVKNPDFTVIRTLISNTVLSVGVITKIVRIDFNFNKSTREFAFDFEAIASDGRKVEGGIGKPFIVDGQLIGEIT